MLMLLSPAKRLSEGPAVEDVPSAEPQMLDQTRILLDRAEQLSTDELGDLMSISDRLADLTHRRFQDMEFPFTEGNARQAALLFDGSVYRGLDAPSLDADDLQWAQDRVVILSGLYGAVRPLDLIQPYRLEMGTKLDTERGDDLYAFWGDRITEQINDWLQAHDDDEVVNLASNEYFSSVDTDALQGRLITPKFKDVSDGKARTIAVYAKKARGAMVRWAIEHRAERAEDLKQCDAMGYRYFDEASTDTVWEFRRPKPPPKSKR